MIIGSESINDTIKIAKIGQKLRIVPELFLLKTEYEKIKLQFFRIKQDKIKSNELHQPELMKKNWMDDNFQQQRREANVALFADIHYLFISLANFDKILVRIKDKISENSNIGSLYAKYDKTLFKEYRDFRNHLEHIYSRIDTVRDLGNLEDDSFTFDGKKFNLSKSRELEIEEVFSEIITELDKSTEG